MKRLLEMPMDAEVYLQAGTDPVANLKVSHILHRRWTRGTNPVTSKPDRREGVVLSYSDRVIRSSSGTMHV